MSLNPLQELLTPYVGELRKSAADGNSNAKEVITLYNMYVRCPEAGAASLCESFFQDWLKEQKKCLT